MDIRSAFQALQKDTNLVATRSESTMLWCADSEGNICNTDYYTFTPEPTWGQPIPRADKRGVVELNLDQVMDEWTLYTREEYVASLKT